MTRRSKHKEDAERLEQRMPPWRKTAAHSIPELAEKVAQAETSYELWFELLVAFRKAYDKTPRDESLIRRIYGFSSWCLSQECGQTADDDLGTCVMVCFYEHIPQHPAARLDMPRWFTLKELETAERIFSYQIGKESFAALRDYFRKNTTMFRKDLRRGEEPGNRKAK
jgi:hypothetical protein